jgi:Ser/Thr protein kinase RdoA (MazF antagonist)
MKNNVRLPTVWLSPQLLAAANKAATQDQRKLGAYVRSLIVQDCVRHNILFDLPAMPTGGLRLDSVARLRQSQQEIDGRDENQ